MAAFATRGLCADVFRTVLTEHGKVIPVELRRALRSKLNLSEDRIAMLEIALGNLPVAPRSARPNPIKLQPLNSRARDRCTKRVREGVDDRPVGIATCFLGFSTFVARPLVNIHDLHVVADYRRRGVGRRLLEVVEDKARELGCCRLTLETQESNHVALALYHDFGFESGQYEPAAGVVIFRQKKLTAVHPPRRWRRLAAWDS